MEPEAVGRRVLEVRDGDIGALDVVAHRRPCCRCASSTGRSHPNGEQSLQIPVMSAVPPSNGKFTPLALIARRRRGRGGCRRPRPSSRRSSGRSASHRPATGSCATSGHASSERTRSTPNSAVPPQASARTDSSTSSARRNASAVRWPGSQALSFAALATVSSELPRSSRVRPSAPRIASASASTRTSERYVPSPPGIARTSAALTPERPDRKFVTGTMATSAIDEPGVGDVVGAEVGAGSSRRGLASPRARSPGSQPWRRRRRWEPVTPSRPRRRRSPRRCPRRSRRRRPRRARRRGREPATRGGRCRGQAAFGGCTGGRGRSRAAAYRSRPDRAPGRRTPRPGGRTGRRKKR